MFVFYFPEVRNFLFGKAASGKQPDELKGNILSPVFPLSQARDPFLAGEPGFANDYAALSLFGCTKVLIKMRRVVYGQGWGG